MGGVGIGIGEGRELGKGGERIEALRMHVSRANLSYLEKAKKEEQKKREEMAKKSPY